MSRRKPEKRIELANNILGMSKTYTGTAILVPGPTKIAKELNIPVGKVYYGWEYPEVLQSVSGLNIIHEGITLGDANSIREDDSSIEQSNIIDKIETLCELLPAEEVANLIGQLAIRLSAST